jgi:DNA ligase D-like protein (predicted ligase)
VSCLKTGPDRGQTARPKPAPEATALPSWMKPQLTKLVDQPPDGSEWLHELKFDGYRMHARLDRGAARLLTRTGLDWTHKYPAIAKAVAALPATQAYLDGELCGVFPDGITSFSMIQAASDAGNAAGLVFFIFDLLHLDGDDVGARPLIERKSRLAELLSSVAPPLHYSDYHRGQGPAFHEQACKLSLEGIVSKRADAPYAPGNRGLWLKVKCLYREEFVVVGWTDPEGRRPYVGALLLAYYDPDGSLIYAGRAGTGIKQAELERLWRRLQPLATDTMPLDVPPPRTSPLRLTPGAQPCTLGAPRAGGRGEVPHLDRRQSAAPGRVRGPTRGQAGGRGATPGAELTRGQLGHLLYFRRIDRKSKYGRNTRSQLCEYQRSYSGVTNLWRAIVLGATSTFLQQELMTT